MKISSMIKAVLVLVILSAVSSCSCPSPTSSPTDSSIISTPTTIAIPSLTSSPTLTAGEKETLVTQLLTKDCQCTLPCWGGIEPGITAWSDAEVLLKKFAEIYSSHIGSYTAEFQYQGKNLVLAFATRDNSVNYMGVPRYQYPVYRLLQDYGKPDEVYFYILDVLPIDANNPYTVFLLYKDKGIMALYDGISAKGSTISICFMNGQGQKSDSAYFLLWSKGSNMTFQEVITRYMSNLSPGFSVMKYHQLEEISTISTDDFYATYSLEINENQCLPVRNPNPTP